MVEAFPRGRTSDQLCVLMGAGFDHDRRISVLAELQGLLAQGRISRGQDGKWRPVRLGPFARARDPSGPQANHPEASALVAAPARISQTLAERDQEDGVEDATASLDPKALLRYWHSALRADPRGATEARDDLHGVDWHLFSGRGRPVPGDGGLVEIRVALDTLAPGFRQALLRREGHENGLAVGWPLNVGRKAGVPVIWPVGLLAARWERSGPDLLVRIDADDVLVNPTWVKGAARVLGWTAADLARVMASEDSVGLAVEEFLSRLNEATAGHRRGPISGDVLASQIAPAEQGVVDAAAFFLSGESSFTARAVRELDALAAWPVDSLASTALAPVLGLPAPALQPVPPLNVGPLNEEQFQAVENTCSARLSVVTGPPGTGKSQAIVSMAASVLIGGGTVLVASKNHQALDAVEDRLGAIAPDVAFVTRTLNPAKEEDVSFADVLRGLISAPRQSNGLPVDRAKLEELLRLAEQQSAAVRARRDRRQTELDLAEVLDLLDSLPAADDSPPQGLPEPTRRGFWRRLIGFFLRRPTGVPDTSDTQPPALDRLSTAGLATELQRLRARKAALAEEDDLVALSGQVAKLARALMPALLRQRLALAEEDRLALAAAYDAWDFADGKGHLPPDLTQAVLQRKPLWLASVLGTGRRIPLEPGLFDLVIFDEASQCDIASAIPLFARAKRAVVVGDNQQLAFIPQLGKSQDHNLMQAQGLPVTHAARFAQSRLSLFDCALRVPDVPRTTLRHQYRSAGQIVDYISANFYGDALLVAQDPKALNLPSGRKPGLAWTDVRASRVAGQGHVNRAEIDAILAELHKLLCEQGYTGSVGVISPFRAQVQALHEAAHARLPRAVLDGAEFRVGTVDGFQGQERDLILFSPTLGPGSPASAVTFFSKDRRRLNVAISRARAVAHVFGDLSFARSGAVSSLRTLAARATEPRPQAAEGDFGSVWEARVYHALKARGLDPHPQHEVAGRYLDFALFGANGVKLDLEVDGRRWHQTPDGRRKSDDIWRDHQLKSLGWRVRRFWVDELSRNLEACLDTVEQDLS